MRTEIYMLLRVTAITMVANGFRTGYHHVTAKVENKQKSPMPVVC